MGLTLHQHSHDHGGHSHNTNGSHSNNYNAVNEADDPNRDTFVVDSSSHGHSHHNINVRAAFIHVVGDLIQSIGVLIAAIIIFFKV
jgi:Co/Zn/Cd efflux system component